VREASEDSDAAKAYKRMLAKGFSEKEATETLSQVGIKYKPPKEKQRANEIISAQEEIEKIKADTRTQLNLLSQQRDRHANLTSQLDDAEEEIEAFEVTVLANEQKIEELENKCAHELGPSRVMLQTAAAVPHSQEGDLQIVQELNDKIVANFADPEDANFVLNGLMKLITSTHTKVSSVSGRVDQLEKDNADLQKVNAGLRAQLSPVPVETGTALAHAKAATTNIKPSSKAVPPTPPPLQTPEQVAARKLLLKQRSSSDDETAYPPEMLQHQEEDDENPFGHALAFDAGQDDEMKKHGATTASEAQFPESQKARSKRQRPSTQRIAKAHSANDREVALHNKFAPLRATMDEARDGDDDL